MYRAISGILERKFLEGFRLADIPLDFLGRSATELEALDCLYNCKACDGMIFSDASYASEAEAGTLDALTAHNIRMFPLMPILQMDWQNSSTLLFREDDKCISWLDEQSKGCVVYVSFGGVISLTKEEIKEVASGLEASGLVG
ncbi:hypothetical protein L7F22_068485 [Adiantum nelumboides]|nr:hypothetical protein [Adiantum nelumboides]